MKLHLIKTIQSPDNGKDQAIWVSEKNRAFYITDRWKIVCIEADNDLVSQTISETADQQEAYQMKGIYDKRLPDHLYDEISSLGVYGFNLLSKAAYDSIDSPAGSASLLEMVNRYGLIDRDLPVIAQNGSIVTFGNKSISISKIDGNALKNLATIKTKGKALANAHLHTNLNLIVYGTNYGEIYGQYFDENGFGKTLKIDNLQKPLYQVGFAQDGNTLLACGMGYVKIHALKAGSYSEISNIQTAAKSFAVWRDYLIINKGMHGIDLFRLGEKTEKISSLDVPFAIDRMIFHQSKQMLLLTSNPHGTLGFVRLTE